MSRAPPTNGARQLEQKRRGGREDVVATPSRVGEHAATSRPLGGCGAPHIAETRLVSWGSCAVVPTTTLNRIGEVPIDENELGADGCFPWLAGGRSA